MTCDISIEWFVGTTHTLELLICIQDDIHVGEPDADMRHNTVIHISHVSLLMTYSVC